MSDLSFEGQVIVVSGATGGIGAATAGAFEARGATVYRLDLRAGKEKEPPRHFITVDVTRSDEVERAVASVVSESGRLDAVIACAGITIDRVLWKLTDEDWDRVLRVNLDGAFYLMRAAAPRMRARASGSIVLVSSINGERGKFGQANYAASKAGLIGLAKSAARELGRFGVRVNVVAPGFIDTPMTRGIDDRFRDAAVAESALGSIGTPDDIAGAMLFLCSPLASHVTGQVLRVDGGQYT